MDAPVLAAAPPGLDDGEGERYAPSKVAGEQAVLAAGMPALICRPGLVVGPEDRSDRFSYWVHRLARASDAEPVLAPGHPDDPVQWIDVADLAAWLVGSAAAGRTGAYDAIGAAVSRSHLLTEIATGVGVSATLTWVDQEFLVDHEVQPWQGERSLPLWLPQPEYAGFMARDVTASLAAGLTTRPAARTARDTLDWLATRPADHAWKCGLDAGDEAHLLAVWQSRRPPP
jgi:nucleoside-diphosphate-sugar epimerase